MPNSMYNRRDPNDLLQTASIIDQQKQQSADNTLRLMQMEGQLEDQKLERTMLPKRLELDAKKLEYDAALQKMDSEYKYFGFIDSLATSYQTRKKTQLEMDQSKELFPLQRERLELDNQLAQIDIDFKPIERYMDLKEKIYYNKAVPIKGWVDIMNMVSAIQGNFQNDIIKARTSANDALASVSRTLYNVDAMTGKPTTLKVGFLQDMYSSQGAGPITSDSKVIADGVVSHVGSYVNDRCLVNGLPKDNTTMTQYVVDGSEAMTADYMLDKAEEVATSEAGNETLAVNSMVYASSRANVESKLSALGDGASGAYRTLKSLMFCTGQEASKEYEATVAELAKKIAETNKDNGQALAADFIESANRMRLDGNNVIGLARIKTLSDGSDDIVWSDKGGSDNSANAIRKISNRIVPSGEIVADNWRAASMEMNTVYSKRATATEFGDFAAKFMNIGGDLLDAAGDLKSFMSDEEYTELSKNPTGQELFGDIEDTSDPDDGINVPKESAINFRMKRRAVKYLDDKYFKYYDRVAERRKNSTSK